MENPEIHDLFFFGQKAFIRNTAGEILLLKTNPAHYDTPNNEGLWDIPGGRIHKNEEALGAFKREIFEETGLQELPQLQHIAIIHTPLRIPHSNGINSGLILSLYQCVIQDKTSIKLSDEHSELFWKTPAQAAECLKAFIPADVILNLDANNTKK